MNSKEIDKLNEFIKLHHKCTCNKKYQKNKFTLKVVNTGIGEFTTIKCKVCGKEQNITDWDSI